MKPKEQRMEEQLLLMGELNWTTMELYVIEKSDVHSRLWIHRQYMLVGVIHVGVALHMRFGNNKRNIDWASWRNIFIFSGFFM